MQPKSVAPFLFAAPFNMSEMVGGCFLVGLLLFTLSVHFSVQRYIFYSIRV